MARPATGPTRERPRVAALVLVALVLVAYLPALGAGFVWDDDDNLLDNEALRSPAGLARIWLEIDTVPPYYPLAQSLLWLEYRLWGLEPAGYHAVNVLLHALNALLVWALLRRLALPGAWLAAALWALHPVQVESVAWITEQKNVLSTAFYLLAALAYLDFAESDPAAGRRGRRYALALGLFVCALLTKTVTATLPVVLLLVLWWKRGRLGQSEILSTVPLFAVGLALGLLTAWMERHHVGAIGPAWELTLPERVLIAGRALWFYAGKLLVPYPIIYVYPRWTIDAASVASWLWPIAALAVPVVLWRLRHRLGRGPLVAVACFAATLSPALGFFNVYYMRYSFVADRWQYLASVALIALAVATVAQWGLFERRWARPAMATLLVGLLGYAGWLSQSYADEETLWRATLARDPDSPVAHTNLGGMLLARGDALSAERHLARAVEHDPRNAEAWNNLGIALHRRGRVGEAIERYRRALDIDPTMPDAWNNLGISLATAGRSTEATDAFTRSVELGPGFANPRFNLGLSLAAAGRHREALEHLTEAARIDPEDPQTRLQRAISLSALGDHPEAIAEYEAVLSLQPDHPQAVRSLAWLLATHPDPGGAARALELAQRLEQARPRDARTLDIIAAAYAASARYADAIRIATTAESAARAAGQSRLATEIATRLASYRRNEPAAP